MNKQLTMQDIDRIQWDQNKHDRMEVEEFNALCQLAQDYLWLKERAKETGITMTHKNGVISIYHGVGDNIE